MKLAARIWREIGLLAIRQAARISQHVLATRPQGDGASNVRFDNVIVVNPPSPSGYVANRDSMGGYGQL